MAYVFRDDKLARVIDPSGRIEPEGRPSNADLDAITADWSKTWWNNTRNGNTSHMILSYPKGVSVDQVAAITRDVCQQMFEGPERHYQFVAAIHDDTEHHPHAHVIVNRRADDDTLFTMRSGTEHSYEGFREAMATHGERYGVYLDPSFRFERGITDRQPDRDEQRAAQEAKRPPKDQARAGRSLQYHDGLVNHASALASSMAVIAQAADARRLEEAYTRLSKMLDNRTGDQIMPPLSEQELERFDQTAQLLGTALERAEQTLQDRDPAARVEAERELADVMKDMTRLREGDPNVADLNREPESASLYEHRLGENPFALRSAEVQERLGEIERDYGIPADAVTARLEAGAGSNYVEQEWIKADAQAIMERDGLRFDNPVEREQVMDRLDEAYDQMRSIMVEARAIEYLPHLDRDYSWEPPERETYVYMDDRAETDLTDVLDHYRQNGASERWIAENGAELLEELYDRRTDEVAAFARDHDELQPAQAVYDRGMDQGSLEFTEAERAEMYASTQDRGLHREGHNELRQAVGEDLMQRYPNMPHHAADRFSGVIAAGYEEERQRLIGDRMRDNMDSFGRGQDPVTYDMHQRALETGEIARTAQEHREVVDHVRENLTPDEYERFERGDLSAADRITNGDPTLARQLLHEVEVDARERGVQYDRHAEDRLREEGNALARSMGYGDQREMYDSERERDDDERGR